ncbi:MAG: apolipoprotein N-acyltransferase, partial [Clostridia bacterium]|nr:apolipoprotein N-acyltransferase [Clostridia bacterium]
MLKLKKYFLAMLSGLMLAAAFNFQFLSWLAWFAMIPFFVAYFSLQKAGSMGRNILKWQSFRLSFIFGLAFFLFGLSWFYSLYPVHGISNSVGFIIVSLAWLILSCLFAAMLGILASFTAGFKLNIGWRIVVFACGWVILEYLQGIAFTGFPWLRLGISQYQYLPVIQSASLFGAMWISALIVMVNGFLAAAFLYKKTKYLLGAIMLFIVNFGYGIMVLNDDTKIEETLMAAIVQGNVDYNERYDKAKQELILKNYSEDSALAVNKEPNLDLILWPETVLSSIVNTGEGLGRKYAALAIKLDTLLYIGGFSETDDQIYNVLLEVKPEQDYTSNVHPVYAKQNLVPFGEYVPMRQFFETIAPNIMAAKILNCNLGKGNKNGVVHTDAGDMGVMICFDSVFSAGLKKQVQEGAEFLVVSTNESWFGTSPALMQHNAHAVFRSVEYGRYLLRSTNGGISCIKDNKGHILQQLKAGESGYLISEIPLLSKKPLYSHIGESIVIIAWSFL